MRTVILAILGLVAVSAPAMGQTLGTWQQEFFTRPAEDGGDVRYAILFQGEQGALQVGCTANRIERVIITFPVVDGSTAPLAADPGTSYSFDNEPMQSADWPVFEAGAIEVPRGAESAAITRRIASSLRLHVNVRTSSGSPLAAEFNLAGGDPVIAAMFEACGLS